MRKNFSILTAVLLLCFNMYSAQVGINTDRPLATLDISGNLRVRSVEKCIGENCSDSILVKNNGGFVHSISKKDFLNNQKTFIYGTGSSSTILADLEIVTGWRQIQFNHMVFDENSDFNSANYTFTAPGDGIYEVYVQYHTTSLISAEDLGVGVFVKRGMSNPELVAEESYLNVNLLGISVSPSTRRTQTLLSLNSGDQVFFGAKSLLALNLVSGSNTFFTIHQVR